MFYVKNRAKIVRINKLKEMKGSDASNMYDEEVVDDEKDYSDDEIEQENKKKNKVSYFYLKLIGK